MECALLGKVDSSKILRWASSNHQAGLQSTTSAAGTLYRIRLASLQLRPLAADPLPPVSVRVQQRSRAQRGRVDGVDRDVVVLSH